MKEKRKYTGREQDNIQEGNRMIYRETGWSTERKQDGKQDGNRMVHCEETAKKTAECDI